ncbi:DUF2877 domain-containing protein [Cryobacterium sp. PAMC25264]|uniref:DUF2877 domain-containing protein n=1 Tax=Cryobacterium sp. PAMC25264 TaxID=2861288 RepID=UPI001C627814|nr:DUF2877 domain-containing protein [Cryobacterium sp. PAMC25264]QYF72262.1 DUF2877 domain-containing protein [Cryobacterium sp. PAMC25264]
MTTRWAASASTDRAVSKAHLVPSFDCDGTIHSVFATSCNIAVGDVLVTVHDAQKQHTPTSVRVATVGDTLWTPIVRVGDRASFRSGWLSFGKHLLDLRQVPIWAPGAPARFAPPEVVRRLLDELIRVHGAPPSRSSSALTFTLARDVTALRGIVTAGTASDSRTDDLDVVIARLIGAGEGLTPTGDDVLVGLLAGLTRGGQTAKATAVVSRIADSVLRNTHRTTDISAHYLRLATRGSFSEPLTNLVDSVFTGSSVDDVHARTREVLSVGATSGADALLGVLVGVEAALDFSDSKKAV